MAKAPKVIPYLSQGAKPPPKPKPPPKVIPYFTHGLGITRPAASGTGVDAPYVGVPGYTGTRQPNTAGWSYQDIAGAKETAAAKASPFGHLGKRLRIGGTNFDYESLIAGDAEYLRGGLDLSTEESNLLRARRDAVQRAVIAAGIDPRKGPQARGLEGGGIGDVDEETMRQAALNPYSAFATLKQAEAGGQESLLSKLAARGIASSGARQAGSGAILEGFRKGESDLTSQLLSAIRGEETGYADRSQGAKDRYRALKDSVSMRIQNDPRYQPIAETDAVLDEEQGLYVTADGRWYDQHGKRV